SMKEEGENVTELVEKLVNDGNDSFYKEENNNVYFYDKNKATYEQMQFNPKEINIRSLKASEGVIKKNTGASLVDLGDGVALLEFTSPNNSIGLDVVQMVNQSIEEEIGRAHV